VAHRIHLNDEFDVELLAFAHGNQPVEDDLPIRVAGKIVVRNKEAVDPLRQVAPDSLFDVIHRPPPRLPSLHVDDRAERAQEGAAASRIDVVIFPPVRWTRVAGRIGMGTPSSEGRSAM
jgi:hypothetical protein